MKMNLGLNFSSLTSLVPFGLVILNGLQIVMYTIDNKESTRHLK